MTKIITLCRLSIKALGKGAGNKMRKIAITHLVFAQKHQMMRVRIATSFFEASARCHVDLASDDRLDSFALTGTVELYRPVHDAVVGKCYRCVTAFLGAPGDLARTACAIQQAVFTVQVQMYEIRHFLPFPRRYLAEFSSCARTISPAASIFCSR